MDIRWDDAQLFLQVAESGSLSAAARQLGLTQPTVSRKLAELEVVLGEPLFERDRSGVRLTDAGERLLEPARQMARWAAELSGAAQRGQARQGVVKITAPPGVAYTFLAPWALRLRQALPDVDLQVLSTVRPLDMVRREADLALRLDGTQEGSVLALALALSPFAAASYLARHPGGSAPSDHDWIGWAPPLDGLSPNSVLQRLAPGLRLAFTSDDYLLQVRACELGLGVMLLPEPPRDLAPSTPLQRVALDLPPIRRTLTLLAPPSARAIPRVQAVLTHLTAALQAWQAPH